MTPVPGSSFYRDGGGGRSLVRFVFCKTEEILAEAARRLRGLHGAATGGGRAGAVRGAGARERPPALMAAGTALVTGASAGIGREFCRQLAARGYDLIVVARDGERLRRAGRRSWARRHGVRVEPLAGRSHPRRGRRRASPSGSRPTPALALLVNNAGFGTVGQRSRRPTPGPQEQMLRLHVLAPMRLTRAALPGMLARRQRRRSSTCRPSRRSSTRPAASTTARPRPTSRPSPKGWRLELAGIGRAGPGALSGLHRHRVPPADGIGRPSAASRPCG